MQAKNPLTLSIRNANGVIDTKHIGKRTVLFTIPADGEYTAILGICGKEETHNFSKIILAVKQSSSFLILEIL